MEFTKIGCTFSRLFSYFCYAHPVDEQPQLAQLEAIARQAAAEMSSVPRADLCIFPSLMANIFWAFSLSNHASPMLGVAHTEPTYQHATSALIWSMASKLAQQRNLPVTLGAIDPVIGNYLQTYLNGLPVAVPPVPIGGRSDSISRPACAPLASSAISASNEGLRSSRRCAIDCFRSATAWSCTTPRDNST